MSAARSAPGHGRHGLCFVTLPFEAGFAALAAGGCPASAAAAPCGAVLGGRCPRSPSVAWLAGPLRTHNLQERVAELPALLGDAGSSGCNQGKKKSIYWDFCYHEGTNNPLPHPSCGLPSRPAPAPAAAATLTGVGQEFNGISRGRRGGRAGSRASRGSPPQPASKPACGWSVPSRCSSSSRPSTPKQPQHPEPAPRQGGPGGIQLFQWLRGGVDVNTPPPPKSQPARGVSEGGLDSPRGAN